MGIATQRNLAFSPPNSSTLCSQLLKPSKKFPNSYILPFFLTFFFHVPGQQKQSILLSKQRSGAGSASPGPSHRTGDPRSQYNVENAAQRDGICIRTLRRAKFDLGVVSTKESISGAWNWALPENESTG